MFVFFSSYSEFSLRVCVIFSLRIFSIKNCVSCPSIFPTIQYLSTLNKIEDVVYGSYMSGLTKVSVHAAESSSVSCPFGALVPSPINVPLKLLVWDKSSRTFSDVLSSYACNFPHRMNSTFVPARIFHIKIMSHVSIFVSNFGTYILDPWQVTTNKN